jgi:hypothetical protein
MWERQAVYRQCRVLNFLTKFFERTPPKVLVRSLSEFVYDLAMDSVMRREFGFGSTPQTASPIGSAYGSQT